MFILYQKRRACSVNRWISILAAAGLGLGFVSAAHAQLQLEWVEPASQGASHGDAITERLEGEARKLAKNCEQGQRTTNFDFVYPTTIVEYRALGANGVILISAVAHDPKEFPLKRVYLRVGGRDVVLQPVSDRQSMLTPTSPLARAIGLHRDDAFFLLPGYLTGQKAELLVDFGANERAFHLGRLSLALVDTLQSEVGRPPGLPDPVALKVMLAREYPTLVKP